MGSGQDHSQLLFRGGGNRCRVFQLRSAMSKSASAHIFAFAVAHPELAKLSLEVHTGKKAH